ncbi:MAG TPA: hypothetical protein VGO00_19885, partial [Kofleriaceae bacterium]|nr:hypothetical protein [Kofleriaceae bacterium]
MRWIVVFAVVALTACRLREAHYRGAGGADDDMSSGDAGPSHELRVSTSSVPGTTSTGTILTSPEGTSCGNGCWRFDEGTPVTLSYASDPGSFLHRWGDDCVGNATTCFVDMTVDHVVSAQFTPANLAFVTSGTSWPSAADPVGSVDTACTNAAHAASRSGTYIGWLGTPAWNTRLGAANGWIRIDGKVVATDKRQLNYPAFPLPHLFYPLTIDERGSPVPTTTHVISGLPNGDCNGWDATAQGDTIPGLAGGSWLGAGLGGASDPCGTPEHLYCFQTDFDAVVPPPPAEVGRIAFVDGLFEAPTGGVSGLDASCATDATNFGLPGTYVALVATTTTPASSRLSTSGLPWVRMDGVPIVATAADLFAAGGPQLIAPLDLDYRREPW